jgi:type I restriction enzyme S subunit
MNLKPYPKYKVSGVPWLGQVPEHWEVYRNGQLFREIVDIHHPDLELLSMTITHGIVKQSDTGRKTRASEDKNQYKRICIDDIGYNLMNCFSGAIGVSNYEGILSPAYAVCRPKQPLETLYYHFLFRSPIYLDVFNSFSYGIMFERNRLYFERFKLIKSPLPSIEEQIKITKYLKYKTAQISRLIRAKKRIIELLKEQKQAIINQAVTRGLDPDVKLKPSGVEWLGKIPEHWEVRRLRYIFHEVDSRSKDGKEIHLSMSQKHGGLVKSSEIEERRLMSESYAGGKLCQTGDVVLNRLKAHLGIFALAPCDGVISPDYTVLRPIVQINGKFYEILLRSQMIRSELRIRCKGIVEGFWRLYTDDFYDIFVPVPPKDEQVLIINKLEGIFTNIDFLISSTEREISLIQEYRTRLIADVVTGKVDVRDIEVPDVADEELAIENLDETENTEATTEDAGETEYNP